MPALGRARSLRVMARALEVLIAGGGPAALEAALRLDRLAGDRVAVTLLSPAEDFVNRPMSVLSPFAAGHADRQPLPELARTAGARYVRAALRSVDADGHAVQTADGESIAYDLLLLAVGAVERPPFGHALVYGEGNAEELMH